MKREKAFTLVEVLMAVTILGIIAVLIIPTLLRNAYQKECRIKLKKGIATLNEAVMRDNAVFGFGFDATASNALDVFTRNIKEAERVTSTRGCIGEGIRFSDGAIIVRTGDNEACFDVDGIEKGPNTITTDAKEPSDCYLVTLSRETGVSCRDEVCIVVLKNDNAVHTFDDNKVETTNSDSNSGTVDGPVKETASGNPGELVAD